MFLEAYAKTPNRVPQWMIAYYLGITPQALSTIRGEIARVKITILWFINLHECIGVYYLSFLLK